MVQRRATRIDANIHMAVDSRYEFHQVLGSGTYGIVCSCIDTQNPLDRPIAVKKVTNIFNSVILLRRALREVTLLQSFRGNKNIIALIDLDFIVSPPYMGLYCYQELMDFDLYQVIKGPVELAEEHIRSLAYQLLCGIKYIHSANIIHRDLKPGNLLINELGQLKVCDFGLARSVERLGADKRHLTDYVATRWYRAPELLFVTRNYGLPVDMWAVGCTLCELIGRRAIFRGENQLDQIKKIMEVLDLPPHRWTTENCSRKLVIALENMYKTRKNSVSLENLYPKAEPDYMDILKHLLQYIPENRPTAEQILNHRYFRMIHSEWDEPKLERRPDFGFESQKDITELQATLRSLVQEFRDSVRTS